MGFPEILVVLVLAASLGSVGLSAATLVFVVRLARTHWVLQNLVTLLGRALLHTGRSFQTTVADPEAARRAEREGMPSTPPSKP